MARQVDSIVLKDFSGGMVLAEGVDVPENAFALAANVRITNSGKIRARDGFRADTTASAALTTPDAPFRNMDSPLIYAGTLEGDGSPLAFGKQWQHTYRNGSTAEVGVATTTLGGATVKRAFTATDEFFHPPDFFFTATTKNYWGSQGETFKYDRYTATWTDTTLSSSAHYDVAGRVPKGQCGAAHNGFYFVGNVYDVGGTYGGATTNRLRWSNPNNPELWSGDDYVDIDAQISIQKLYAFQDRLVIVTTTAVYVMTGYTPFTWQIRKVFDCGTIIASCITPLGVAIYALGQGVGITDGNTVNWISDNVLPAFRKTDTYLFMADIANVWVSGIITMFWRDDELFVCRDVEVSAEIDAISTALVWDSRHNAWTVWSGGEYIRAVALWHESAWKIRNAREQPCILRGYVTSFGDANAVAHIGWLKATSGASTVVAGATYNLTFPITLVTGWFDGGNPAQKKRWKRPEVLVGRGHVNVARTVDVTFYKDWDGIDSQRASTFTDTLLDPDGIYDPHDTDGSSGYAGQNFAADDDGEPIDGDLSVRKRLSSLGSGRAVQARLRWTPSVAELGVHDDFELEAIVLKLIAKRVR